MEYAVKASNLLLLTTAISTGTFAEWDVTRSIELETRGFIESERWAGQDSSTVQFAVSGNIELRWRGDQSRVSIIPSARYDHTDDERSLVDLREAYWGWEADDYELLAGINTVFWGVTESVHLVDIINQTDLVADIDGEDKLGQPMINLETQRDWGRMSIYLLPYFRERTFPGLAGRLRTPQPIDTDNPVYESSREQDHLDIALRYSHFFGDVDVGISWFKGTSREPRIVTDLESNTLRPYYDQIYQVGVDLQYTRDAWLWKLEAITRDTQVDSFIAAVGGLEYTFYQVTESGTDLGVLFEAQFDDRAEDEAFVLSDNDFFSGIRLALNDTQDTSLLAGVVYDWESGETFINLEAERRFGESVVIELRSRLFTNADVEDTSFTFEKDDYVQFQFRWYF